MTTSVALPANGTERILGSKIHKQSSANSHVDGGGLGPSLIDDAISTTKYLRRPESSRIVQRKLFALFPSP
jgi:hypothetical protein